MKKTILTLGLAFILFLLCPLGHSFVFGLENKYPDIGGQSLNSTSNLADFICYLYSAGMNIVISLAVVVIAFGGILFMLSYITGKLREEGKEWVKAGILGAIIAVSATSIINTINPSLTNCIFTLSLQEIGLDVRESPSFSQNSAGTKTFKEIPIGTLTEKLLTGTTNCYAFDPQGNPIDGFDKNSGQNVPTYLDHDRADCITQALEGAQKKAQIIADVSAEIYQLMNQCDCAKYGECGSQCNEKCDPPTKCPGGSCKGSCVKGACKLGPSSPKDCCPKDSGVEDPKTGKILSVKDLIEHGPITLIPSDSCPVESLASSDTVYDKTLAGASFIDASGNSNNQKTGIYFAYNNNNSVYTLANMFTGTGASGAASFALDAKVAQINANLNAELTRVHNTLPNVQTDFRNAVSSVQNNLSAAVSGVQSRLSGGGGGSQDVLNELRGESQRVLNDLKDALVKFKDHLNNNVNANLKKGVDDVKNNLSGGVKTTQDNLAKGVNDFKTKLNEEITKVQSDLMCKNISSHTSELNDKINKLKSDANKKVQDAKNTIDKASADARRSMVDFKNRMKTDAANKAIADAYKQYILQNPYGPQQYPYFPSPEQNTSNTSGGNANTSNSDNTIQSDVLDFPDAIDAEFESAGAKLAKIANELAEELDNLYAEEKADLTSVSNAAESYTNDVQEALGCDEAKLSFRGLDEFRSDYNNDYDLIKRTIEKTVRINGRLVTATDRSDTTIDVEDGSVDEDGSVTAIKDGNCGTCDNNAASYLNCKIRLEKCKKASPWHKLKLIDQLTYLKGKAKDFEGLIKHDENILDQARNELASPKCYLSTTYMDLLKIYEKNDNKQYTILKKPFSYWERRGQIEEKVDVDASKYCSGFNYNNSSCFKECNDKCPDSSQQAMSCYKSCDTCQDGPSGSQTFCTKNSQCSFADGESCDKDYNLCLTSVGKCQFKQQKCVEKCYESRPCTKGYIKPGSSADENGIYDEATDSLMHNQTFADADCRTNSDCPDGELCNDQGICSTSMSIDTCITSCQSNCSDICSKKYYQCSGEYQFCLSQCQGNSQCLLDNSSSCLLGPSSFQQCGSNVGNDPDNNQYCINRAYYCKNGSDQYAGYQDCVKSGDSYSSSYLYGNSDKLKCPDPNQPAPKNSSCYSGDKSGKCETLNKTFGKSLTNKQKNDLCVSSRCVWNNGRCTDKSSCENVCPETQKCPASSDCPNCSCDSIDQSIDFSVPLESIDKNMYIKSPLDILAYQLVGPQCNGYSYNDDPLTFYCQDSWWTDPDAEQANSEIEPLGEQMACNTEKEVPVGQTVDNAKKWVETLTKNADSVAQDIQNVIDMAKKIGQAKDDSVTKDYCTCVAKYRDGKGNTKPVCTTDCDYMQIYNMMTGRWECSCDFVPCKGKPCQAVMDYLSKLWGNVRQARLDFIGFYTTMIQEPRSDIMKELTYSRKMTNSCNLVSTNYFTNNVYTPSLTANYVYGSQTRLLSCTRAKDEIAAPDGNTCYGRKNDSSLTDDWLCCEQYKQNITPGKK